MANLTSDTLTKANGVTHDYKSKFQDAGSDLEKMAHTAGEKMGSMASQFSSSAADYVKTGREYVKENPAKGVAIAAAAGIVAGSLITLAMRQRQ